MGTTIDPELRRRVAAGEYEVDPHAVAEAIVRRAAMLREARRISSEVLVALEVDGLSVAPEEPGPGAGDDLP